MSERVNKRKRNKLCAKYGETQFTRCVKGMACEINLLPVSGRGRGVYVRRTRKYANNGLGKQKSCVSLAASLVDWLYTVTVVRVCVAHYNDKRTGEVLDDNSIKGAGRVSVTTLPVLILDKEVIYLYR